MAETKFLDKDGLAHVLESVKAKFSKVGHAHTKAEITDFAHNHDDSYYKKTEVDSKLSGKSDTSHNHDGSYYKKTEIDTKLAGKSDTSHSHATHLTTEIAASANLDTLTAAGWYKCSSNATASGLTNCPTEIAFAMEVLSNAGTTQIVYEYCTDGVQKIYTRNYYGGIWGAWQRIYTEANKPTLGELGAAASGHTHNYAGSSSSGGSATSAVKLDSSAGSATQPVYFSGGKPVATTYTLGKSVPADAVFTDTNTHYTSKNVVGSSAATSNTTTALTNGNVYLNSIENGAVTSAHKISGSGATTVTTDTSGNIVVSSTNTTYSSLKNPYALTVSLNGTSQGAYDGSAAKSINVTASSVGAYTKSEVDSKLSTKYGNDISRTKNAVLAAPATADGSASFRALTAADIPAVNASAINGTIAAANLPSFVDDVLEGYYNSSDGKFYKNYDATNKAYSNVYTGETGKIYVNLADNKTYRWSGSAYVVISETIALGETSTTAYRGDRGKAAYDHAAAKGSAFASGFYKITTNAHGHVTAATAVAKTDITALGIPAQDTVYTHPTTSGNKHIPAGGSAGQFLKWSADGTAAWGTDNNTTYSAGTGISLSGTTFSNSGVRAVSTGTSNGTISVNTGGTTANVSVKGLGSAAYTASTAYAAASHTHSYLPLSGGTVTGATCFEGGTRVKAFDGTSGTAGYVLVATISITKTYQNSPIELTFSRRGDSTPTRLSIGFASVNSTDPALSYFKAFGTTNAAWLYKSATSTWQLYVQKTEGYDRIDVLSLLYPSYDAGISITWGSGQISTMYTSNVTQASYGYIAGSASTATSATTASSCSGNAATATKLATARNIQTNLGSTSAASFNGTANVTPGVTGTLPIGNGGTGTTSANGIRTNIGVNPVTTGGTGAAYTASVNGITSLTVGASFVMVPHTVSTTTAPTLNVNDLGAKNIRMRLSTSTNATIQLTSDSFLTANKPIKLMYDGAYWIIDDVVRPNVNGLYGTVPISKGGTGATTAAQALVNLGAMPQPKSMTMAAFNSLASKNANTLYMITDDTEEQQVQDHLVNTTVHITSAERTNWNAKANVIVGTKAPSSSTSGNIYVKKNSAGTGIDAVYINI